MDRGAAKLVRANRKLTRLACFRGGTSLVTFNIQRRRYHPFNGRRLADSMAGRVELLAGAQPRRRGPDRV